MYYLVSYPRSGNTWARYCLEFISGRPTVGYSHKTKNKTIDEPIGSFLDLGVDLSRPELVTKRHEVPKGISDKKVILLLRNPREVILRHFKSIPDKKKRELGEVRVIKNQIMWYQEIIDDFHQAECAKTIIYYEDLISNREISPTLRQLCEFLEISDSKVSELVGNIEFHRQNGLKVYNHQFPSYTRGNPKVSHAKKAPSSYLLPIDRFIKQNLTYLSRYHQ